MTLSRAQPEVSCWWMTSQAWSALHDELARLDAEVARAATAGPEPQGSDPVRRHRTLRAIRDAASIDDGAERAAIGRRVTVEEEDGATVAYTLVLPGHGDPARGAVSADSPLGMALLGARAGDAIEVAAPAGAWTVTVLAIG